jgi:hypothetical protein
MQSYFSKESELHKEAGQKFIKELINIISYFGKEHLLKGTEYYERYISHVAFYKLKVDRHEKVTKKVRGKNGVQGEKIEDKAIYYIDPKFNCEKVSKTKKSDTVTANKTTPSKTSQVEVNSLKFRVEGKVAYTIKNFNDIPKKFFAPTKSILNFFTILLELFVSETNNIFKNVDTKEFNLDMINTEGKYSKLIYLISKLNGRHVLENVKFDTYQNEMINNLYDAEHAFNGSINKLLINLININGEQKSNIAKVFINFVFMIMINICTQKATRAEKKYTTDLDCFLNFLQYYHFINKSELNFDIHEIPKIIREGDKAIVQHLAQLKSKDKEPPIIMEFETVEEFVEYEKVHLKKIPKITSSNVIKNEDNEEVEEDEENLDD